ncbi:hypothetical protein M8C21_022355, partial [Ambrosia artemisiifolia]
RSEEGGGGGCADSVISFSPCLPYISAPPNNLSTDPSSQCCETFDSAFDSDEAQCLCYLVRQTTLLGFPLNLTKLFSLSDICPSPALLINNNNDTNSISLRSICSGSPTLPPMIATPRNPPPSGSNARRPPPPPPVRPPPSTMTHPRPPARNNTKPSTSDQTSNHQDDADIWFLLYFVILYFYFWHNVAAGTGH